MQDILRSLSKMPEKRQGEFPVLRPGDTVRVLYRIVEGDRDRLQPFQGVVMRLRGHGPTQRFTVRRLAAHGVGVERTFVANSPRVEETKVLRHGQVRRAQLYFLRGRVGKKARLRERRYDEGEQAQSA
ncbi:MAG: 50S ribosomal protein L19 [Chloroflexi bacterium]|nr:50S ribosomal protein L19 [Chloroflexota bacterium]MBI3733022.1 50S ribosomal protein L19 [Chloroflexota bacterium]